jgi:hypothetical protein
MIKKLSFVFLLLTSNLIEAVRTPKGSPKGKEATASRVGSGGGLAKKAAPRSPKRNPHQASPQTSPNTRLAKLRLARSTGEISVVGCKVLQELMRASLDATEVILKRDVAEHADRLALGKGPGTPSPIKRAREAEARKKMLISLNRLSVGSPEEGESLKGAAARMKPRALDL